MRISLICQSISACSMADLKRINYLRDPTVCFGDQPIPKGYDVVLEFTPEGVKIGPVLLELLGRDVAAPTTSYGTVLGTRAQPPPSPFDMTTRPLAPPPPQAPNAPATAEAQSLKLSPREAQIHGLRAGGLEYDAIATRLGLSGKTVRRVAAEARQKIRRGAPEVVAAA